MEISDFAGKDVIFKFQSRYDEDNMLAGTGLWIDDLTIYKISSGSLIVPFKVVTHPLASVIVLV